MVRSRGRAATSMRPPRGRKEDFSEWRQKPPRAVTFEPLETLTEEAEQLHLAHPLVRRILDRFVAQGYGAHDLSRVSAVVVPGENVARIVAYARLTFFGHGAARLHDELIAVAAPAWAEVSRDEAVAAAQRVSQGRVLSVEKAESARRPVWRVKILTAQGEVRVILIDAENGRAL